VGAEHRGDAAVEVPAERHLLARHLGVEVDDDDVGLTFEAVEQGVGLDEGRASRLQLHGSAEVDHRDSAAADLDDRVAAAGIAAWVVGGPYDTLLTVEEAVGLAMAVDVVAGRDHIGAGLEDVGGGALGDAQPAGRVLPVDDHQLGVVALAQCRHRGGKPAAARAADDVADEQDLHPSSVRRRGLI